MQEAVELHRSIAARKSDHRTGYLEKHDNMNARIIRRFLGLALIVSTCGVARAADVASSPALPETTPWDGETLSQAPNFEWLDEKGPVRTLFYEGEVYGETATRVFAYYATPGTLAGDTSQDKNLPGVVLVHGGGGTAFREWVEMWAKRGYAAIAMDLAGQRPIEGTNAHAPENRVRLSRGGPNQGDEEKFGHIGDPVTEQWPYHAVANVIRAHSLLRSFPEVDADRTAVTGISWGGYLTCIVAGVDSRFRAAVPVYGCGFLHDNSAWLDRLGKMDEADRERWIELWDPSRYLPAVSMPIFFVNGTNDFAYPLDSYQKSIDAVTAPKQTRITVNMPHGHPPGWAPEEIGLFVDQHLRGGDPLAELGAPRVVGDKVQLDFKSSVPLKAAELHTTTDDGTINKRMWQSQAGTIDGQTITTPAPPKGATAWFITVTDERGAIVSSEVQFAPPVGK